MKQAVVVTGLPASGKTTVARQLAELLNLPLLDKDDFLEELYEEQFPETRDERRELSKISDTLFQQCALNLDAVVLVSHWRPSCGLQDTGTPTQWVQKHFDRIVEVNCECSPEMATTRFLNRTRHPGHLDQDRDPADLAADMAVLASGYPLGLGALITVNTEAQVDLPTLAAEVLRYQSV
ncbi:hypothetical protein DL239_16410 [Sedimentitalea sp. CY04]|uniref:ATP-binding protein n=1 Tax=Parasedimentitalea denitrificans TaxID=2211118 RepID=A0ABX0WAV4_9RHOB|nr:AAA family ATPase [Sedimentitalea sp. CY04]NIZ62556.1 hypothetical protein [Sedimentitalea sp. CY04]